jgi:hypothetical protein
MKVKINSAIKSFFLLLLLEISLGIVLQSCTQKNQDREITIGEKGNLDKIIIPNGTDEVIKFAATELRDYFKKITGKELQIKEYNGNLNDGEIRFVIEDNKAVKWDGYSVEVTRTGITLSARESRGLLYAAYTLLEHAGCSFFYPGESEEIVPRRTIVEVAPYKHIYNPVLQHRGLALYGLQANSVSLGLDVISWMAKNKMNFVLVSVDRPSDCDGPAHGCIWKDVSNELLSELQRRGFVIEMSEHCAPVFFPRSLYKDHPDWFALTNGVRQVPKPPYGGQMCYSNKDGVEYYATAIANYAKKHPEFHIIGTWPLDGGEYCECENCKDHQTIFKAVNRVAEKVKQVRPDMIVEYLADKTQSWTPPQAENIPRNMSVLWCQDPGNIDEVAREWVKKSDNSGGTYQFEYYMGDNYRSVDNVWLRPAYSAGIPRYANEIGFRGVVSLFLPIQNWWRASFNNSFFAKACWDSILEVNATINEYCRNYYGAYASEVENVFKSILTELQPEPYTRPLESEEKRLSNVKASSGKIISAIDNILSNVEEPDIKKRVLRLRAYVEYSLIHCEAFASLKKSDLERLVNYSKEHPDQDMVLMYPGYIRWRNEEYFTR